MNFKIKKFSHNQIQIIGLENINGFYAKSLSELDGELQYKDTVTLNLLYKVNEDNEYSVLQASFSTHEEKDGFGLPDITLMLFDSDGLFKVYHIILPTTGWINSYVKEFKHSPEEVYNNICVSDLQNLFIYHNGELLPIDIDELLTIKSDTVHIDSLFTFNYDGIKECLANKSASLLRNLCEAKCPDINNDSYIRDILWMTINVIEYLLEQGSFFEALRILNIIHGCGNVCPNNAEGQKTSSDCGCNK